MILWILNKRVRRWLCVCCVRSGNKQIGFIKIYEIFFSYFCKFWAGSLLYSISFVITERFKIRKIFSTQKSFFLPFTSQTHRHFRQDAIFSKFLFFLLFKTTMRTTRDGVEKEIKRLQKLWFMLAWEIWHFQTINSLLRGVKIFPFTLAKKKGEHEEKFSFQKVFISFSLSLSWN